ncbi:unnamed protein product [Albugo candida]|uniref:t-SNARE coiled-coil homology domain-containing protein n=1 Tax=Albugo candida TaxID=65357 RepID=A0A024GIZ9_9STRA|nr:unnamed protein product [Albugo candida]|eukprot:CCI46319.1 unnamed protein product [Albugo candida]
MGRQDHPMYHNSSSLDSDGEIDYQNMSAQEYEQRKNAQMSDQDNVLDQIHTGVKGLKNHANAINGEVVEQNAIIDDLGNRMDQAQADLEREELIAREVNAQKKKSCKLYVIVGILIAILVTLYVV